MCDSYVISQLEIIRRSLEAGKTKALNHKSIYVDNFVHTLDEVYRTLAYVKKQRGE